MPATLRRLLLAAPLVLAAPPAASQVVENTPPQVAIAPPAAGAEGRPFTVGASAADADGDPLSFAWSASPSPDVDAGAACTIEDATAPNATFTCDDDGTWVVRVTVDDGRGGTASAEAEVVLANEPPVLDGTEPGEGTLITTRTPVELTVPIADPGGNDSHACLVSWGGASAVLGTVRDGVCRATASTARTGPWTARAVVVDDDGGAAAVDRIFEVMEPDVSVRGAGWMCRTRSGLLVLADMRRMLDGRSDQPGGTLRVHRGIFGRQLLRSTGVDVLMVADGAALVAGPARLNGRDVRFKLVVEPDAAAWLDPSQRVTVEAFAGEARVWRASGVLCLGSFTLTERTAVPG